MTVDSPVGLPVTGGNTGAPSGAPITSAPNAAAGGAPVYLIPFKAPRVDATRNPLFPTDKAIDLTDAATLATSAAGSRRSRSPTRAAAPPWSSSTSP